MKFTTFLQLFTYVHQSYSFFVFFSFWDQISLFMLQKPLV